MTELSFDMAKQFEQAFEVNKSVSNNRDTYKYGSFDLCRNTGSVMCKLIPEESGRPYKCVNDCYTGTIPYKDEEGNDSWISVRVCDNSNFKSMSDEDKTLNNELIKQIEKCNELEEYLGNYSRFKFTYKMFVAFAAIRKVIKTDKADVSKVAENGKTEYTDPKITTIYCRSKSIMTALQTAINSRKELMGSSDWMNNYFNRKTGKSFNFLNIITLRPEIKYECTVELCEVPTNVIEVKQEDLDEAKNLDEAFINVLKYDTDFYKDALEKLINYNKTLEKTVASNPQEGTDSADA